MKQQTIQKVLFGGLLVAFVFVVSLCSVGVNADTPASPLLSSICNGFEQILDASHSTTTWVMMSVGLALLLAAAWSLGLWENLFVRANQFLGSFRRGIWRHLSNVFAGTEFRQLRYFRVLALATVDPQVYS